MTGDRMRIEPKDARVGDTIKWPSGLEELLVMFANGDHLYGSESGHSVAWLSERGIVIERPEPEEVEGVVETMRIVSSMPGQRQIVRVPESWPEGTPVIVRKVKA